MVVDEIEARAVTGGPWAWSAVAGPVDELVGAEVPDGAGRTVRLVEIPSRVLVLGSTQADPPATAWPTARRRSGGGGVLLVPGEVLWVDVVVPRGDPWWDDDVGRAAHPVGDLWARALGHLGIGAEVHRGPLVTSRWSPALCFAGLGPGEVTVEGRKVVGIAQRRTRAGACFQCAVPLAAPHGTSVAAVGLVGQEAVAATAHLERTAGWVSRSAEAVAGGLREALEAVFDLP